MTLQCAKAALTVETVDLAVTKLAVALVPTV
jgi:hypothetical protein